MARQCAKKEAKMRAQEAKQKANDEANLKFFGEWPPSASTAAETRDETAEGALATAE